MYKPFVTFSCHTDRWFLGVEELKFWEAGQEVEVVKPSGWCCFEYIAPYQIVLLIDKEFPSIGLVGLVGFVQPITPAGLRGNTTGYDQENHTMRGS